jgi:hypothetical protein
LEDIDIDSDAASFATADDTRIDDVDDIDDIYCDDPTISKPGNAGVHQGQSLSAVTEDYRESSQHPSKNTPDVAPDPARDLQTQAKPPTPPVKEKDLDICKTIPNMYRILDLVKERGSGGLVDKIIIAQDSFQSLINAIEPDSCPSMTKCDFAALDKSTYNIVGVYGDRGEIVRYLQTLGIIDSHQASSLNCTADASVNNHQPYLRSGIYGILDRPNTAEQTIHAIYWPEDLTWNDDAPSDVRRNRITFIRYLTKIADQVLALVSPSQASRLVWKTGAENDEDDEESEESNDEEESDRLFSFEVSKSKEQEENVTAREGFKVFLPRSSQNESADPAEQQRFATFLARGDSMAAFVTVERVNETSSVSSLSIPCTPAALRDWIKDESFRLTSEVNEDTLTNLLTYGLDKRAPEAFAELTAARQDASDREAYLRTNQLGQLKVTLEKIRKKLLPSVRAFLQTFVSDTFCLDLELIKRECLRLEAGRKAKLPVKVDCCQIPLPISDDEDSDTETVDPQRYLHDLLVKFPHLQDVMGTAREKMTERIRDYKYRRCRDRIFIAATVLDTHPELHSDKRVDLVRKIIDVDESKLRHLASSSIYDTVTSFFGTETISAAIKQAIRQAEKLDDVAFWQNANAISERHSILAQHIAEACKLAIELRCRLIEEKHSLIITELLHCQESMCRRNIEKQTSIERQTAYAASLRKFLVRVEDQFIIPQRPQAHMVDSVWRKQESGWPYRTGHEMYKVVGRTTRRLEPMLRYCIYPLYLSEIDRQTLHSNPQHIPSPTAHRNHSYNFDLAESFAVEYLHVIQTSKAKSTRVLLITRSSQGDAYVYLEEISVLSRALSRGKGACKKQFNRDKMGSSLTFGFDETKRQLVVCTETWVLFPSISLIISWWLK